MMKTKVLEVTQGSNLFATDLLQIEILLSRGVLDDFYFSVWGRSLFHAYGLTGLKLESEAVLAIALYCQLSLNVARHHSNAFRY
jgi:hypothetical protein